MYNHLFMYVFASRGVRCWRWPAVAVGPARVPNAAVVPHALTVAGCQTADSQRRARRRDRGLGGGAAGVPHGSNGGGSTVRAPASLAARECLTGGDHHRARNMLTFTHTLGRCSHTRGARPGTHTRARGRGEGVRHLVLPAPCSGDGPSSGRGRGAHVTPCCPAPRTATCSTPPGPPSP
jgi:hypothetical protein